jgi:hypothetical protein
MQLDGVIVFKELSQKIETFAQITDVPLVDRNKAIANKDERLPKCVAHETAIELPHDTIVVRESQQIQSGRNLAIKVPLPMIDHLPEIVLITNTDPFDAQRCLCGRADWPGREAFDIVGGREHDNLLLMSEKIVCAGGA